MINYYMHSCNAQRPNSSCNLGHWKQRQAQMTAKEPNTTETLQNLDLTFFIQTHLSFKEALEVCDGKWVREGASEVGGGRKLLAKGKREVGEEHAGVCWKELVGS